MTGAPLPHSATRGSVNGDWVRALERTAPITLSSTRTLAAVVAERAGHQGARPAIIGEGYSLTYAELSSRADLYARWAEEQGLRKGDCVALMLGNAPDYAAIWIGLGRIGVVTALLNTQLVGAGLAHCVAESGACHLIAGVPYLDAAAALEFAGTLWSHGTDDVRCARIEAACDRIAVDRPLGVNQTVTLGDTALLIYTSGTTGLPKAARVSHFRVVMWSEWFAGIMDATPDDRLFDCLPMYHSIGGVVAVGAMLAAGGAVILRDGFSASRFWQDIVASQATIFQYIGELCRYLLAAPPPEAPHHLRLCVGNGLRADVWTAFEARFAIPRIIEFYAATEGSFSLFNLEGRPGAIGRIPRFMAHRSPVALVAFDDATEIPVRDEAGRCLRCTPGEIGEAIGMIARDPASLALRFEGYTSEADTQRKILRDVFVPGDMWFRTGDLMRQDKAGFFYFVDRIGETFRWKGENVATSEVTDAIGSCPGVLDVVVYGVTVPRADGRAGMAALVTAPGFDLAVLHAHVAARLPRFARPVFVRLRESVAVTGTFKPKKQTLTHEGFDPARVEDPLYVDDPGAAAFVSLDAARFDAIVSGATKL